jgi:hypothetical protein
MRLDSIDLYGPLLIKGQAGTSGKVIAYDANNNISWTTVAAGSATGSTTSFVKTELGYNYVYCETVNTGDQSADQITNGQNLNQAYQRAKALNVGTKSVDNRVTILLMPGVYNTQNLTMDTSFIDLVGVSSEPYHTVLRSTSNYVLSLTTAVDTVVKNLFISEANIIGITGNGGSFLRFDNLVLGANTFGNTNVSPKIYGFNQIRGEFLNIKGLTNCDFVVSSGTVSGYFDNIELTAPYSAFYSERSITGTFSNILINSPSVNAFYSTRILAGVYENIEINSAANQSFFGDFLISGTYKNIKIKDSYGDAFKSNLVSAVFDDILFTVQSGYNPNLFTGTAGVGRYYNIETNTPGNVFYYTSGLGGYYNDINLGDVSNLFVSENESMEIFIRNVNAGNISGNVLSASFSIDVEIDGFKCGNVSDFVRSSGSYINGIYKDIYVNDFINGFVSSTELNGVYNNINLGNSTGTMGVFKSDIISADFKSINIGDCTNNDVVFSSGTMSVTLKDFKVGNSYRFIRAGNISGEYKNITFGSTDQVFFVSGDKIENVYVDNLKSYGTHSDCLRSGNILTGTFSNIHFYNQIDGAVFLAEMDLDIYLDGFSVYQTTGNNQNFRGGPLTGTFKNIQIGTYSGANNLSLFVSSGFGLQNVVFENIEVKSGYDVVFYASGGTFDGTYKNITIDTCNAIFEGSIFNGTIDNLNSKTPFMSEIRTGKMYNSTIICDQIWTLNVSNLSTVVIENCKFLGTSDLTNTIDLTPGSSNQIQILYTVTTNAIGLNGNTLMNTTYNINNEFIN